MIHERDGRADTDTQTPHDGIGRAYSLCIASRGKNQKVTFCSPDTQPHH